MRGHFIFLFVEKEGQTYLDIFIFFHYFLVLQWWRREKEELDHFERRRGVFIALALYWCFYLIVQHVLSVQALALTREWKNTMVFSICFESMKMSNCSMWTFERKRRVRWKFIFGLFHKNIIKQRTCVSHNSFSLLWELRPKIIEKEHTYEKGNFN